MTPIVKGSWLLEGDIQSAVYPAVRSALPYLTAQ